MSNRHGGGYVPGQQAPPLVHYPQRHGGGYVPGQDTISSNTSSHQSPSPPLSDTARKHEEYVQVTPVQPYEQGRDRGSLADKSPSRQHERLDVDEEKKSATRLANYGNLRHPQNSWRLEYPNAHLKATWKYDGNERFRHKDALGRVKSKLPDDRYLSPYDGRIKPLVVQTTDEIYKARNNSTYMRTFVRNVSPFMLRVAMWPTNHFDYIGGQTLASDYWTAAAKWISSTIALMVLLPFVGDASGQERNGGKYDVFPYKHYTYPKIARNVAEDDVQALVRQLSHEASPEAKRALRPRYLCFMDKEGEIAITDVEELVSRNPGQPIEYVFIAYTASQFSHDSREDMEALHDIAKRATRDAGLHAYWVGCSCMPDDDQMEEDVYRISDVIRGAHSLIIAIGPSHRAELPTTDLQLQEWRSRMWTYSEVLLSPGNAIKVYPRSGKDSYVMPKKQFAATAWADADVSRQLIDHYEGSLLLSRLELVTLALQCLHSRSTSEYLPGDHSYALMGLLRLRPKVDRTDSALQAFARLSMANDSDMLLERLIATLPKDPNQQWSNMEDAWDSKLWDIHPTCQVAGVGHNDTVIIDSLRGANRLIVLILEHSAPVFLYVALGLLGAGEKLAGGLILLYSLIAIIAAPYIIPLLYAGKFWQTQPWLFGFEGHLSIETIEKQIFGTNLGRLEWSPYSSPLSRRYKNRHGECVGVDPTTDPETARLVQDAVHAQPGDIRVFTIVDTGNMEVTMFQAVRPPVAFLLAGEEGGMQRAIGVSYEWETATCYRETVIRMPTPTKSVIDRVNRVRFGLKRGMMPVKEVA